MSAPIAPVDTEAQQILDAVHGLDNHVQALTEAINSVGESNQWIVDNVKGVFEMFNNPMFKSMLPGVMASAAGGIPNG